MAIYCEVSRFRFPTYLRRTVACADLRLTTTWCSIFDVHIGRSGALCRPVKSAFLRTSGNPTWLWRYVGWTDDHMSVRKSASSAKRRGCGSSYPAVSRHIGENLAKFHSRCMKLPSTYHEYDVFEHIHGGRFRSRSCGKGGYWMR